MNLRDLSGTNGTRAFAPSLLFAVLGVVATAAKAAPPGPPPEAISACASSKEGDACTVKFGSESLDGTCTKDGDVVACRPTHMPPPPKGSGESGEP